MPRMPCVESPSEARLTGLKHLKMTPIQDVYPLQTSFPGIRRKIASGNESEQRIGIALLMDHLLLRPQSRQGLSVSERAYLCQMLSQIVCQGDLEGSTRLGALYALGLVAIFKMAQEECCMARVLPVMITALSALLIRHVKEDEEREERPVLAPKLPVVTWTLKPGCHYEAESFPDDLQEVVTAFTDLVPKVRLYDWCEPFWKAEARILRYIS